MIAVDEAGYGPKIGPLCIAATCWTARQWPADLEASFEALTTNVNVDGVALRVDDSKRIFQPRRGRDPLATLTRLIDLSQRLIHDAPTSSRQWIQRWVNTDDLADVRQTPWLAALLDPDKIPSSPDAVDGDPLAHQIDAALGQWRSMPWQLTDVDARWITARRFNAFCGDTPSSPSRGNKSDLLTQSSLSLVAHRMRAFTSSADHTRDGHDEIHVYFDRHGGRRYYAGVIQHVWPDLSDLVIESETPACSRYRFTLGRQRVTMQFTVKGDRFAPVALASLHAKWLREFAMTALNDYFETRWKRHPKTRMTPFRSTAGYPVDADRFLGDVEPILAKERIAMPDFVRCR